MTERWGEISLEKDQEKKEIVYWVDQWRCDLGFSIEEINSEKPWGAYWKIGRQQIGYFMELFFPEKKEVLENLENNLSPKLLLVAPHQRLSWQYHDRRAEEWKVVIGEVEVMTSKTNEEPEQGRQFVVGEGVNLDRGVRHRLIGGDGWGLVAEIWIHTDPEKPSDEEDIVRLSDEYGR